jgi:sec-independent protein translocase protein TatA
MGLSVTKLLLILVIVFVIFGAGKLPKVMGDLGKGIKALKDGIQEGGQKPEMPGQIAAEDDKNKSA